LIGVGSPRDQRREAAMPKRWKVAAVVTLTDQGQPVDEDDFDWETDDERKAKNKFEKVKRKLREEPPIED
jgi:hypothetical protein